MSNIFRQFLWIILLYFSLMTVTQTKKPEITVHQHPLHGALLELTCSFIRPWEEVLQWKRSTESFINCSKKFYPIVCKPILALYHATANKTSSKLTISFFNFSSDSIWSCNDKRLATDILHLSFIKKSDFMEIVFDESDTLFSLIPCTKPLYTNHECFYYNKSIAMQFTAVTVSVLKNCTSPYLQSSYAVVKIPVRNFYTGPYVVFCTGIFSRSNKTKEEEKLISHNMTINIVGKDDAAGFSKMFWLLYALVNVVFFIDPEIKL